MKGVTKKNGIVETNFHKQKSRIIALRMFDSINFELNNTFLALSQYLKCIDLINLFF